MGLLSSIFGGGGSNSSSTSTSTSTQVTDRRTVADNGAVVFGEGGGNTVYSTDHGAIEGAVNVVQQAILGATQLATKAQEEGGKTATAALGASLGALDFAGEALKTVGKASDSALDQAQGNRTLALAGLVLAGLLAIGMVQKRKASNA